MRLLPTDNRASALTKKLDNTVSDGGHFTVILEDENPEKVKSAHKEMITRLQNLKRVHFLEYTWPVDYIEKYRYLLVPSDMLEVVMDELIAWEAEVSPFIENLKSKEENYGKTEERNNMESSIKRYVNLSRYHQTSDGKTMGILVHTKKGISSFGETQKLYKDLKNETAIVSKNHNVWIGIGGSHRNKMEQFDTILGDINTSGFIAGSLILLILLFSFRSLGPVFVVTIPLFTGLLWGFSIVPVFLEGLNLITAFLVLIIFGLGIDYSIHIVKRFILELTGNEPEKALIKTYLSTGISVIYSALTTALALFILALSDFRGFSEFGFISSTSLIIVMLSMFIVLPAVIALGYRLHLLKPKELVHHWSIGAYKSVAVIFFILTLVGLALSSFNLKFNYSMREILDGRPSNSTYEKTKEKQRKIYSSSMSPGAVYVIPSLEILDKSLKVIEDAKTKNRSTTLLGRVRSVRTYGPGENEIQKRLGLIKEIQEQLSGRWTRRVKDKDKKDLIENFKKWSIPACRPSMKDIPPLLTKSYMAKDDSGQYIMTIHPYADRKDGEKAMGFTRELYDLKLPQNAKGPVGETIILAEIIWLVQSELGWLIAATLLGVFLLILANQRSFKETLIVLLPLISGMIITFGIMALFNIKLNFFNVVVIPALLGMGVDDGVHYFRRWKELDGDTDAAQKELFEPLTITTITTMLGYSGMMFAHHNGIQSIGIFACIGLSVIWMTSLFLLPGFLKFLGNSKKRSTKKSGFKRLLLLSRKNML